jgi:hypothetical protein
MYHSYVVSRIDEVWADWLTLADCPSFYLSPAWLRAMEGALGPDHFYILVRADGDQRPIAGIPCHLIHDRTTYLFYNLPQLLIQDLAASPGNIGLTALAHTCLDELYPVLTCVAPSGYISAICYRSPLVARGPVAEALVAAVEHLASTLCARTVCFLYVPEGTDQELHTALIARDYQPFVLRGQCYLPIQWTTFTDYLRALSRKRREAVQREIRRFQERGLTLHIAGGEALTAELAMMHVSVQQKYGHTYSIEQALATYQRIQQNVGTAVRVFIARRQGQAVGFSLFYAYGAAYYARLFGVDYGQVTKDDYLYFSTLFYEPIRQALHSGVRLIHYGIEGYTAKVARGCQVQPLLGYAKFPQSCAELFAECIRREDQAQRLYLKRACDLRSTTMNHSSNGVTDHGSALP